MIDIQISHKLLHFFLELKPSPAHQLLGASLPRLPRRIPIGSATRWRTGLRKPWGHGVLHEKLSTMVGSLWLLYDYCMMTVWLLYDYSMMFWEILVLELLIAFSKWNFLCWHTNIILQGGGPVPRPSLPKIRAKSQMGRVVEDWPWSSFWMD